MWIWCTRVGTVKRLTDHGPPVDRGGTDDQWCKNVNPFRKKMEIGPEIGAPKIRFRGGCKGGRGEGGGWNYHKTSAPENRLLSNTIKSKKNMKHCGIISQVKQTRPPLHPPCGGANGGLGSNQKGGSIFHTHSREIWITEVWKHVRKHMFLFWIWAILGYFVAAFFEIACKLLEAITTAANFAAKKRDQKFLSLWSSSVWTSQQYHNSDQKNLGQNMNNDE